MKYYESNGWYHHSGLTTTIDKLVNKIQKDPTSWLEQPKCKYVEFRIDCRTGDFIIKDQNGIVLTKEEVIRLLK